MHVNGLLGQKTSIQQCQISSSQTTETFTAGQLIYPTIVLKETLHLLNILKEDMVHEKEHDFL